MKKSILLLLISCVLVLPAATASASASPATAPTAVTTQAPTPVCDTDHVHFAKTKFLFHAGLALGVFHRYVWKPYRAGSFKKGSPGRVKAMVKAGVASLFVVHELKIACKDANSSRVLKPLLTPLQLIVGTFTRLTARLKSGNASPDDLAGAAGAVAGLGTAAKNAGVPITEITTGFSGG